MSQSFLKNSAAPTSDPRTTGALKLFLYVLVMVLTFEGLARKLAIPGTNVPIFLLKDFIILILGFHLMRVPRPPATDFLWGAYFFMTVLFLPCFLATALHDPILAFFGAKEYLLYPFVGLAVFTAFHDATTAEIIRFFRWLSILIIPTAIIALIQLRLPPTHWLNLSVEGETIGSFSAAGKLRVSSTFSFVAQYGAFLNAEMFMLIISLNRLRELNFFWKAIYLSMVPLMVISCYITGSRGAVVGNMTIIAIASLLIILKLQGRNAFRVLGIVGILLLIVALGHYFLPDEFAAYSEREQGKLVTVSGEIQGRVYSALFGWITNAFNTPFFGYGVGLMSNGSDTISSYADGIRSRGIWTETDFATTLYEGGVYLILIWYGFRYYVIYQTTKRSLQNNDEELSLPGAFSQAFVILVGLTGTLGMQPPLAIWWWLTVGSSLVLWWKSVGPVRGADGQPIPPPAPLMKKFRGRSAYAERLHADK